MIDLETLNAQAGPELVEEARNSMDVESISAMKFDKRGRLEAGVKPAPPSTQPSSYVRITRRGQRFQVDCRKHGRGGWCLHAAILVLHHLGQKPNYVMPKRTVHKEPRVGYRLVVTFTADHAEFRILGLSTNSHLRHPLPYLLDKPQMFRVDRLMAEMLEDLGEDLDTSFRIPRVDLAPLLHLAHEAPWFDSEGNPWKHTRGQGSPPGVSVRIKKNTLFWKADPFQQDTIFIPGWPGYMIQGNEIKRYPGYVTDLQHLKGRVEGSCPADGEAVMPFLKEKHRVTWESPKPQWLSRSLQPGLSLEVDGGNLVGRMGFWQQDRFLPLENLEAGSRFYGGTPPCFLTPDAALMARVRNHSRKLRAPWEGASFTIREGQAAGFLERAEYPDYWRVNKHEAENWFGLTRQNLECEWDQDGSPRYRVGDEWFEHQSLMSGLGIGDRVRLPDGRTLNIDTTLVRANEQITSGVGALHEDTQARNNLLGRIAGNNVPEGPIPPISESWRKLLRSYQLEGVQWMAGNFQRQEPSLLADDMGLGKTIQTLAYLDSVREDLPQLVVAPKTLLHNWREECRRFSPHRKVILHHGPNRTKNAEQLQKKDLVITTYGTVLRDIEMLYDVEFQIVALDEAQAIKNARSQTAVAVRELWSRQRLALTGTPVENRLTELWSIFEFLAPGYLGDEEDMKRINLPGSAAFMAVRAKVAPFVKRRLKTEVEQDLPEKQEITLSLPMAADQATLYQHCLRDAGNADKQDTMSILTKLLRLRQICCHPGLVDELHANLESNKLAFLSEHLEEVLEAGHSVLVFSQFTSLLKLVHFQLEEQDRSCFYMDGKTNNRQELVDRFQAGERPIFLISLKAGGTGLNLTRASYVYHLDPWWNPAVEAQATDRAHRIGQTRKVISYKLISEGTVEEKILKLQKRKRLLADGLWDQDGMGGLDRETLLELLT